MGSSSWRIAINTVMNAYANSKIIDKGLKAEELLNKMERSIYNNTNTKNYPKPDKISYHTVMNAYSKEKNINSGYNAERISRKMWGQTNIIQHNNVSSNITPDTMTYNI